MAVSAPTQLATASGSTTVTTGSLSPTAGAMLFAYATALHDEALPVISATVAGTLSATWVAVGGEVNATQGSIRHKTRLWVATTYTGSGTVSVSITNGAVSALIVGRMAADGALSVTASGSATTVSGTNTATYTPAGTEAAALYFNSSSIGGVTHTAVSGATEVAEFLETNGITDHSWGYDITPAILSTLGSTHATPSNTRACTVVGVAEAGGGETQDVTPAAETVTVTAGTLTLTVDVPLVAPSVEATPGTAIIAGPIILTGPTVEATPGTAQVDLNVAATGPTIGVTAGTVTITTGAVNITPAAVTVEATPGTVALSIGVEPAATTVEATPGAVTVALVSGDQNITPAATTVAVTPGTVTVSAALQITPDPVVVEATPGTLALSIDAPVNGPTVNVTAGTLTLALAAALTGPTVEVTAGTVTVDLAVAVVAPGVTVTAGTVTVEVSTDIDPTGPTVEVTPGTVVVARTTVLGVNCAGVRVTRRLTTATLDRRLVDTETIRRLLGVEVTT